MDEMDGSKSFLGKLAVGDEIVMTKWIALKGSIRIVNEKYAVLREHFSQPFLNRILSMEEMISVRPEKEAVSRIGGVSFYEVSEGGIFGALWDFAAVSGVGLEVGLSKIPVLQETIEISEVFQINPYQLMSDGCLLIGAKQGNRMAEELEEMGIPSCVIGTSVKGKDRKIKSGNEYRFLTPSKDDEYYKIM